MASSVGTPSSSSSAVPSIDLLTCFIKALTKKKEDRNGVKRGITGVCVCVCVCAVNSLIFGLIPTTQYLIDSVSMCTGAILSNRNLTISRKGLLGCLGLPSFLVMSLWKWQVHFSNIAKSSAIVVQYLNCLKYVTKVWNKEGDHRCCYIPTRLQR